MFPSLKRAIVVGLNGSCNLVDRLVYADPVITLTRPLPRWYRCELGRAAKWLDTRWKAGYWSDGAGPTGDLCAVCKRRATWLVRYSADGVEEPICAWCE
jgi:hypothetical protein